MRFPRYVYALQNEVTKRIYVGSTYDVGKRFSEHISTMKRGKCKIEDMQCDFDKASKDFSIRILDKIYSNAERNKEYEWMIKLNSHKRGVGYNYNENPEKYLMKEKEVKQTQDTEKAETKHSKMKLDKLKEFIKKSGCSMKSCYKAIGVSESQFYKKMNGSQVFYLEECEKLGNFLGMTGKEKIDIFLNYE